MMISMTSMDNFSVQFYKRVSLGSEGRGSKDIASSFKQSFAQSWQEKFSSYMFTIWEIIH